MQDLTRAAIQASLDNNWEEAIDHNLAILAENPADISALNRLARAYNQLDQKDSAKEVYKKVLKLDKYNAIASRFLRSLPSSNGNCEKSLSDENFIEQPGLTRSALLIKPASKEVLLSLVCKEQLELAPRARLISVKTMDGTYVGSLPDDLSLRLSELIKRKYQYTACVKNSTDNSVTIFLRETKRPNNNNGAHPSFSLKIALKDLK